MSGPVVLQTVHGVRVDCRRLKQAAHRALQHCSAGQDKGLTIVITSADAVRQLNYRHRQRDAPTDVLTFPAANMPDEIDESPRYLGDILIAHDYVKTQAAAQRLCLGDALCLLVIHGTLHLLGYEHGTARERERMWAAQARALQLLAISPQIVNIYGDLRDA